VLLRARASERVSGGAAPAYRETTPRRVIVSGVGGLFAHNVVAYAPDKICLPLPRTARKRLRTANGLWTFVSGADGGINGALLLCAGDCKIIAPAHRLLS